MKQHMDNKPTQRANEDLVGEHFSQDVYKDIKDKDKKLCSSHHTHPRDEKTNKYPHFVNGHAYIRNGQLLTSGVVQKASFVDVHLCGKLSPPLANWITPGQVIRR